MEEEDNMDVKFNKNKKTPKTMNRHSCIQIGHLSCLYSKSERRGNRILTSYHSWNSGLLIFALVPGLEVHGILFKMMEDLVINKKQASGAKSKEKML